MRGFLRAVDFFQQGAQCKENIGLRCDFGDAFQIRLRLAPDLHLRALAAERIEQTGIVALPLPPVFGVFQRVARFFALACAEVIDARQRTIPSVVEHFFHLPTGNHGLPACAQMQHGLAQKFGTREAGFRQAAPVFALRFGVGGFFCQRRQPRFVAQAVGTLGRNHADARQRVDGGHQRLRLTAQVGQRNFQPFDHRRAVAALFERAQGGFGGSGVFIAQRKAGAGDFGGGGRVFGGHFQPAGSVFVVQRVMRGVGGKQGCRAVVFFVFTGDAGGFLRLREVAIQKVRQALRERTMGAAGAAAGARFTQTVGQAQQVVEQAHQKIEQEKGRHQHDNGQIERDLQAQVLQDDEDVAIVARSQQRRANGQRKEHDDAEDGSHQRCSEVGTAAGRGAFSSRTCA